MCVDSVFGGKALGEGGGVLTGHVVSLGLEGPLVCIGNQLAATAPLL